MIRALVIGLLSVCACSSGGAGTLDGSDGGRSDAASPPLDKVPNGPGSDGGNAHAIIDANDFDHSCTRTEDCTLVFSGDLCTICHCGNATIARSAAADYTAKQQELQKQCPGSGNVGVGCACAASDPPACIGGRCVLAPAIVDAGADG